MANPGENGRRDKSRFSHTCSLLSQYVKEKGGNRDLAIDMLAPRLLLKAPPPTEEPQRKPVVLPDLNVDTRAPQMTIFYSGKVMVFDNFPEEKAKEIIALATEETPAARVPTTLTCPPPASTSGAPEEQKTANHAPLSSDLPIARRVSLNRFLEKRKDRISSKAPYQVQGTAAAQAGSSSSSPEDKPQTQQEDPKNWLALAPGAASSSSEQKKQ